MTEAKLISASQLAKNLSLTKHTLDELLISAGFIQRDNENFILTKIGEDHGGQWQTYSIFAERKRAKKAIYEKYNFKLIELRDEDVFNLDDVLPKMLLKFGVQTY